MDELTLTISIMSVSAAGFILYAFVSDLLAGLGHDRHFSRGSMPRRKYSH